MKADQRRPLGPDSIGVGSQLPPFSLNLSLQRLVREAAVNRDFSPIHHNARAAQISGTRTAYANTMLLQALIEAMLRNWAGPHARIRSIEFAMLKFCLAGSVATARGEIAEVGSDTSERWARIGVSIHSDGQTCVEGTAVLTFPLEQSPLPSELGGRQRTRPAD